MTYKEEIIELEKERRESLLLITQDIFIMYFRTLLIMPFNVKLRKKLLIIYYNFLNYYKNEGKILSFIKRYYGLEENNGKVEFILNSLDSLFAEFYDWFSDFMEQLEMDMSLGDVTDLLYEYIPLWYDNKRFSNDINYLRLGLFKKDN